MYMRGMSFPGGLVLPSVDKADARPPLCRYGKKPYNIFITYFASAVWHGFYAGYYMFFLSSAFLTFLHRKVRRRLRPWFLKEDGSPGPYKPIYDFFCWFFTIQIVNYFILSFLVLSLRAALRVYRSLYFGGHIIAGILLVIFGLDLFPQRRLSSASKKAEAKSK